MWKSAIWLRISHKKYLDWTWKTILKFMFGHILCKNKIIICCSIKYQTMFHLILRTFHLPTSGLGSGWGISFAQNWFYIRKRKWFHLLQKVGWSCLKDWIEKDMSIFLWFRGIDFILHLNSDKKKTEGRLKLLIRLNRERYVNFSLVQRYWLHIAFVHFLTCASLWCMTTIILILLIKVAKRLCYSYTHFLCFIVFALIFLPHKKVELGYVNPHCPQNHRPRLRWGGSIISFL